MLTSPKFAGWASRLESQESRCSSSSPKAVFCRIRKSWNCRSPKALCWRSLSCSGRACLSVLFRLSTDLMRPTYIWRAICFTRSPLIYMLISSKNTLTEMLFTLSSRNTSDGVQGLIKKYIHLFETGNILKFLFN